MISGNENITLNVYLAHEVPGKALGLGNARVRKN